MRNNLTGKLSHYKEFPMKQGMTPRLIFALSAILFLLPSRIHAQAVPEQHALFETIRSQDAQLFDAYNHCDIDKFIAFFPVDVEFFDDRDGLSVGKADLAESIKENICGKVTRELVPGSLQVYPLNGYGAVEIGVHRFHHPGHDDTEPVGEAKFIHIWQYKDGAWKLARVVSFDHHAAAK